MFQLYEQFGHLYDLHTPATHYQRDHQFVLERASREGAPPRLLDIGCGTGILLQKALGRGFEVRGIDAAVGMIDVARARLGGEFVARQRMQDLDEPAIWDVVTALSWTLHYCEGEPELIDVLTRCRRALRPGGLLIAQVAHAASAAGEWYEDREPGPTGIAGDIVLRYRFERLADPSHALTARYACTCASTGERFDETHRLEVADAHRVAHCAREAGLVGVELLDSWHGDPFECALSPWLLARCPRS